MFKRDDIQIRDPFVYTIKAEGTYYLFGTTDTNPWNVPGVGFEAYASTDLENWDGPFQVFSPNEGFWGTHDFWAPEVHYHQHKYYLFASFKSKNHRRGTQILVSNTILGPYRPVSDRSATPEDWECLDGTLYVDGQGLAWIVFCHEWVQVNDGEICAMPLSSDLMHPAGPPVVLFKASAASWPRCLKRRDGSGLMDARVTDGPFLHRQADDRLVMLWSSLAEQGYAMGCAVSDNGQITGPWRQSEPPLIVADGGHGMVFSDIDGRLFITYHTPNKTPFERFAYRQVRETSNGLKLVDEELG